MNWVMTSYDSIILTCLLTSFLLGGNHILHDAFSDGSSVICDACKSLVPRVRWEQHNRKWCPALPAGDDDDDL